MFRRTFLSLCILLVFSGFGNAQTLKMPAEVKVIPGRLGSVTVEWEGDSIDYLAPPDLDVFREFDMDAKRVRLRMIGYVAGKHTLFVAVAKAGKLAVAGCMILVGDAPPPVPPVPPVPPNPPVPPVPPIPPVPPAPIQAPGLRVLIVEETAERNKLKPGQLAAIFGQEFRDMLRSKTAKDADNPNGAFRIWDKDVDCTAESKPWREAMKRPMASYPWIIISNPDKGGGYEGPLSGRIEYTIDLLKKFGG